MKLVPGTKFGVGVYNFLFIKGFHLVPGTNFDDFFKYFICIFNIFCQECADTGHDILYMVCRGSTR